MPLRSRIVQLTLPLTTTDHDVFVSAVEILQRLMGRKAPTLVALVQHSLRGRDAKGIADDYLDFIGWPRTARTVALSRHELSPVRQRFRLKGSPAPADPSRN